MNDDKKRKNLLVGKELSDWYEERSRKTGLSQTSLIIMAMTYYKDYLIEKDSRRTKL